MFETSFYLVTQVPLILGVEWNCWGPSTLECSRRAFAHGSSQALPAVFETDAVISAKMMCRF